MKIIGITGGLGSGKSSVSKILEESGAYIIDADKINHAIMLKGNPAYNEIIDCLGDSFLYEGSGEINRKALGEIVFSDKAKLARLVEINHKYITEQTYDMIAKVKDRPADYKFIVIDAPLLIEAGFHKICDEVWVVFSRMDMRIERVIKRDNITRERAIKMINNQLAFEEMEKYADFVIENNGTAEQLKSEVYNLLER